MYTMKKLGYFFMAVLTLSLVSRTEKAHAQQDPMYTQYIHNMLAVNPAYAGSRDAMSFGLLHRSQWVGIEGAPTTQNLFIHSPLKNQNFAWGFSAVNDEIGPTSQTGLYGDFAARIQVSERGRLAFGLKAGFNYLRTDLTSLTPAGAGDPSFQQNVNEWLPNIGAGLYYDLPNFFFGFTVPKILRNDYYDTNVNDAEKAEEVQHYFLQTGGIINIGGDVKLKLSTQLKMVPSAPLGADFTLNCIIRDAFWIGGFYRLEDAAGVMLGYNLSPQLFIGYAYDYTTSELSAASGGSHEVVLTYDLKFGDDRIVSPRYF
jgi:type IX secretion system PorP/SprF family membrane protein